jgi:hypothetical protein
VSSEYACHSWLDGNAKLIIGTRQGEILILENSGEFQCTLDCSPGDGLSIECIVHYTRGFIVGCSEGYIFAYEKVDEPDRQPF